MDTGTMRDRLHEYINQADQKHLEAMYTLLEKEMEPPYQYDDATLEMLYKRREAHLNEQSPSYSAKDALQWIKDQPRK